MLFIERNDVRDMLLKTAGSDKRQWTKGSGSVRLLKPSRIQGQEADAVMFLPADHMDSAEDPALIARRFLTLMGRARQEIWILFTKASTHECGSARLFASLLRPLLETRVNIAAFSIKAKLHRSHDSFLAHLDLTAHSMGGWQFLVNRGRPVALYEDYRDALIKGPNRDLNAFAEVKGWPVLSILTDRNGKCELHSTFGAEKAHDELRKRKAAIDRQLALSGR